MALGKVNACNCSICSRSATLLAFVPDDQFKLLSGADVLTDYQFNKKHIYHQFCSICGIRAFSHGAGKDGRTMRAINVRCLEGVDIASLEVNYVDGKSL